MIQGVCLLLLIVAVLLRARRSYRKPAWWATLFGLIALGTYGVAPISPVRLDALLGGRNILTLVRDVSAVTAMFSFHNAVAVERNYSSRRLPWWSLFLAVAAFAVPFAFINDPGHTSTRFVLDRLSQTSVWLFATIYTVVMGLLAGLTLWMLSAKRTAPTVLWVVGLSLMMVSDVLEVAYLAAAHFSPASQAFREQYYYVAELPFFSGVALAVLGFIWILGARAFWWTAARWTLSVDARGQHSSYRTQRLALARWRHWSNRQLAFDSAANVRDRVKIGLQELTLPETLVFGVVERTLSNKLEEVTP
ncbi:hypothetical protein ITJ49_15190 [Frondihabitans sp. VKM Ac-2883]|nr:hypothetical protein [Frondihabitans sp. VKM Ac-2883]